MRILPDIRAFLARFIPAGSRVFSLSLRSRPAILTHGSLRTCPLKFWLTGTTGFGGAENTCNLSNHLNVFLTEPTECRQRNAAEIKEWKQWIQEQRSMHGLL